MSLRGRIKALRADFSKKLARPRMLGSDEGELSELMEIVEELIDAVAPIEQLMNAVDSSTPPDPDPVLPGSRLTCPRCDGQGKIVLDITLPHHKVVCPTCHGKGWLPTGLDL